VFDRSGDEKSVTPIQVTADGKIYQYGSHKIGDKRHDWQHYTKQKGDYETKLADNKCYVNNEYDKILAVPLSSFRLLDRDDLSGRRIPGAYLKQRRTRRKSSHSRLIGEAVYGSG
jgi:hypothetical protein